MISNSHSAISPTPCTPISHKLPILPQKLTRSHLTNSLYINNPRIESFDDTHSHKLTFTHTCRMRASRSCGVQWIRYLMSQYSLSRIHDTRLTNSQYITNLSYVQDAGILELQSVVDTMFHELVVQSFTNS